MHDLYYRGSLTHYWEVLYAAYSNPGNCPFEFELPNPKTVNVNEHVPENGDEIIINFWDKETHRRALLTIEAELVPDEADVVHIFVHPHVNAFEEPGKSAMAIWKEIKAALKKAEKQYDTKTSKRRQKRTPQSSTLIALTALREIYFKALKSKKNIIPRMVAAKEVGLAVNTWRQHDIELWNHWEDKKYRNQNMQ